MQFVYAAHGSTPTLGCPGSRGGAGHTFTAPQEHFPCTVHTLAPFRASAHHPHAGSAAHSLHVECAKQGYFGGAAAHGEGDG